MHLDEIEDLVRRYLATGVAVVVVLAGPVAGAGTDPGATTSTAPSGVVDAPGAGDVEIRDGSPGADAGTDPTADAEPGGAGEDGADEDAGRTDGDDEAGAPSGDRDGSGDADRDPADPSAESDRDAASDPDGTGGDTTPPPTTGTPGSEDPDSEDPDSESPDTESPDTGSPDSADPGADVSGTVGSGQAATAAERFGWGPPERSDEFRTTGLEGWEPYSGPGHRGRGERSPDALTVDDGVLTVSGDARGTTGGACWDGGQRYGRWEARVRAPEADPAYHALLLLWPDADDYPTGGQVAFLELTDPDRRSAEFYLHHGEDGDRVRSEVRVDATRWHAWAVEWTREGITGYVDGEEWFSSTDPATPPPRAMHLCVQLDFFPTGDGEVRPSRMEVDWVRSYGL